MTQVKISQPSTVFPDLSLSHHCGHVVSLTERRQGRHRWHCADCEARRVCVVCGASLAGALGHAVTCSDSCRYVNRYEPAPPKPCPDCGVEIPGTRNYCERCAAARKRETNKRYPQTAESRARYRERLRADPVRWELERARRRNVSTLRRRTKVRFTDVTPAYEAALRQAKVCEMCGGPTNGVVHVDHIVPLAVHGTHTRDNLRALCAACNLKRPKDGSDVHGHQANLFMAFADESATVKVARPKTCRRCGSDAIPQSRLKRSDYRCAVCWPVRQPAKPKPSTNPVVHLEDRLDMPRILQLRADGFGYKRIAREVGATREQVRAVLARAGV